ncbi:hypothetical protein HX900_34555 [Rhizobium sp. WYCCWR 11290]|uniref:TIR domain-containing protein n=1 Tax=Rhizobium changzhiense TaxID=2692317 RepID=A0A7Z0UHZ2_9HYPH|nr:hypothetical protein [Rhizobium changzhiense]NZD66178.1 hypothetical protein [Rhizobium changzhiense]
MASNNLENAKKRTSGVQEIRVFLCYRRQDGALYADWLYHKLNNTSYVDTDGNTFEFHIYYDKTAPAVSDWKQFHFPSLQSSRAMILICTPGIAIDLSKDREPDWVYEELRWWCSHRGTAPIVVDATKEGDRWLPSIITKKWPDINRIDLSKDDVEATDIKFVERVRERITGGIRESERRTVFEDLQRFKKLTLQLKAALSVAAALLIVALISITFTLNALNRAKEQQELAENNERLAKEQQELAENNERLAQEQKRIVQLQIAKLIFLNDSNESDEARDAFATSLDGTTSDSVILTLMDRAVTFKSNLHSVANAISILECYGPYNGSLYREMFEYFFANLSDIEDREVKLHLESLKEVFDADQSGRPRTKNSKYDRCQWFRNATAKNNAGSSNR